MNRKDEGMTLTEFLLARITEDEAVAKDAGADAMMGWRWKAWPRDAYDEIQATVIANSRRVLAECEAKRRIVELHEAWPVPIETPYRKRFGSEHPTAPMLAAMAVVYADHQDFREEWRVS